jgi:hypothetical protein
MKPRGKNLSGWASRLAYTREQAGGLPNPPFQPTAAAQTGSERHVVMAGRRRGRTPCSPKEVNAMSRGPNCIERLVFVELMTEISRIDGTESQGLDTAYGDMSRLVVGCLACTSPDRLVALYNELGLKGSTNARQFHLAIAR